MFQLLIAASLLNATPDPKVLLEEVHQAYLKAGDIEGEFTHTFVGGLRGKKKVEHGRLWAKPDGRVRWQYDEPEPKYFIYDGKNAYFYEPQKSQVMVYENLRDSRYSKALRFLIGQGDLNENFNVAPCKQHCGLGDEGDVVVELTPKEPLANVDHLALVVDPQTKRIKLTATFDSLGYRSEYRFKKVTFGGNIKDGWFVFKKPKNVAEVSASQFEEAAATNKKK